MKEGSGVAFGASTAPGNVKPVLAGFGAASTGADTDVAAVVIVGVPPKFKPKEVEGAEVVAGGALKVNPVVPMAPGAEVVAGAAKEGELPNAFDTAAGGFAVAAAGALSASSGLSQDAHLVAPLLFFDRHVLHFTPSLILLLAQMPNPASAAAGAGGLVEAGVDAAADFEASAFPIAHSQEAHLVAPLAFLDMQVGHFTPSLILLIDQMLLTGADAAAGAAAAAGVAAGAALENATVFATGAGVEAASTF